MIFRVLLRKKVETARPIMKMEEILHSRRWKKNEADGEEKKVRFSVSR